MLNRKKNERGEIDGLSLIIALAVSVSVVAVCLLVTIQFKGAAVALEEKTYVSVVQSKLETLLITNPSITKVSLTKNSEGQYIIYGWGDTTGKAIPSVPFTLESVDVALNGNRDEYKIIAAYSNGNLKFIEKPVEIPGYGSLIVKVYDENHLYSGEAKVSIYDSVTREITSK